MIKIRKFIFILSILTLGVILLIHKPASIKIKNNLFKGETNVEILF
ncbi:hypothetical protein AAGC94_08230 [Clostridium sporogenes]|nr:MULTISPECIES: hypothetical protein [Clostridium]MCG4580711.1 hypothetical protein [Clostridium cochlearium]